MAFNNNGNTPVKVIEIVEALEKAKNDADEKSDPHWWKDLILLEWNNIRNGKNNTKWVSIKYRLHDSGKFTNLNVCIVDEVHTGQIMPTRAEDVAELQSNYKNKNAVIEKRLYKPSLQIQKWTVQVPTQEDKVSLVMKDGKPILPEDKYKSKYFQLAEYLDEIVKYELQERIDRYHSILIYIANNKGSRNNLDTLETVKEIRSEIGHVNDGDTIITDADFKALKDKIPNNINELTKGFIKVTANARIAIIQSIISNKALKNADKPLPNPITRITIPFDVQGNPHKLLILDKEKMYRKNGLTGFENLLIDDKPVNVDNIHKAVISKSRICGIVCMDSICFSQVGISVPIKISEMMTIQQPPKREFDVFKLCQSIFGDEINDIPIKESNDKIETPLIDSDESTDSIDKDNNFDELINS